MLKFVRLEGAYLSRRVQMKLEGAETEGAKGQSVLEGSFELPAPQGTDFPSGQLGTIFFKIADDAPEGAVPVPADAWIDGKAVAPDSQTTKVEPGKVNISKNSGFCELLLLHPLKDPSARPPVPGLFSPR